MPAFATHYIFARKLEDKIREYDKELDFCPEAFYFGTQGPDFLFAHRIWRTAWNGNNLMSLGSELHHCDAAKLFGEMQKYLNTQNCDKSVVKSYIYGFICHYSLDRTAHPYIYAAQKEMTEVKGLQNVKSMSVHSTIEYNIDTLLLRTELGHTDGRKFNEASTLTNDPYIIEELSKLMFCCVPAVIDRKVSLDDYRTAFNDMYMVMGLKYDPTGIKRRILRTVGAPVRKKIGPILTAMMRQKKSDNGWDYLNLRHKKWTMVFDSRQSFTTSFMDLFRFALDDAFELIKAFNEGDAAEAVERITGNMSFDTGVRFDITEPIA